MVIRKPLALVSGVPSVIASPDLLDTSIFDFGTTAGKVADGGAVATSLAGKVATASHNAFRPTGYLTEAVSRSGYLAAQAALTSGTLRLQAVYLESGVPITALDFVSSAQAAVTPLNQWAGLFDFTTLAPLVKSADATTAAWALNTLKSFAVTYTPSSSGLYYVGLLLVATTVPTLMGYNSNVPLSALAPVLAGNSSTGLTTPASCPANVTAPPGSSVGVWCGVKA